MSATSDKTSLEFYALRILPEAQVRKFRYRSDLLQLELYNEARFPEVQNVLSDVFIAVKEKDFKKFLLAHRQLDNRVDEDTLIQSIRYSISSKAYEPCGKCEKCKAGKKSECINKKKAIITKREAYVLQQLNKGKSLIELF